MHKSLPCRAHKCIAGAHSARFGAQPARIGGLMARSRQSVGTG